MYSIFFMKKSQTFEGVNLRFEWAFLSEAFLLDSQLVHAVFEDAAGGAEDAGGLA